ncbi:protein of unknown function [Legionella hackeliae]|uniref:Uncharacterized protein n=1 Tax=Legionella hackeliae TaxID=449 RepID=A0A0A8UTU3_LEGHA|nr:protein of unknown function [Legionella hackeliae]
MICQSPEAIFPSIDIMSARVFTRSAFDNVAFTLTVNKAVCVVTHCLADIWNITLSSTGFGGIASDIELLSPKTSIAANFFIQRLQ